jgi:hypothetical protein
VYSVETVPEVDDQVAALPSEALAGYAELLVVLEVAPWGGDPFKRERPDGNMRTMTFGDDGQGLLTYLILEDQRRVVIILMLWLG